MQDQPIASLGFWADASVPLSIGVDSWKTTTPKIQPRAPSAVQLLKSLPFEQELEVRDRLATAKEIAGVGNNIRWDLIIEEAAKLPCGLRNNPMKPSMEKTKGCSTDDDADHRSTSASDSGEETNALESDTTELEASSHDEATIAGKDVTAFFSGTKLPPWRRSRPAAENNQGRLFSELEDDASMRPWRRAPQKATPDSCTRVYTITTLLQCWVSMQRGTLAGCEQEPSITDSFAPSDVSVGAPKEEKSTRTSPAVASNAPWRRRPRSVEVKG